MLKRLARAVLSILPQHYRTAAGAFRTLSHKHAHFKSARERACIDFNGDPIPWYTYPAIDYIGQLDWRAKTVFEYGSGNSTLFWSRLAKSVVSVESDEAWYARSQSKLPAHCNILLKPDRQSYCESIAGVGTTFDVIIVDGLWRLSCAQFSRRFLNAGGVFILDNSDWHPKASAFLRHSGLLEVDMTGFGPINPYTWTTSFYFSRDFNVASRHDRQPVPGVGNLDQTGDDD